MPRRTVRLTTHVDERLQAMVKDRGYANPSVFLRAAIEHELSGREDKMTGAEERLAAIARGANVPMEPDLSEAAHSRRWGILLAAVSIGFMAMMALIARSEPDAAKGLAVGLVPLAAGFGFLIDFALIRRDLKSASSGH